MVGKNERASKPKVLRESQGSYLSSHLCDVVMLKGLQAQRCMLPLRVDTVLSTTSLIPLMANPKSRAMLL